MAAPSVTQACRKHTKVMGFPAFERIANQFFYDHKWHPAQDTDRAMYALIETISNQGFNVATRQQLREPGLGNWECN